MSDEKIERTFSLPKCQTCPLSKSFQFYRESDRFIDVTVSVGVYQFKAHRIMLAHSSPVLKTRLYSRSSSNSINIINIELDEKVVSYMILEDILNFFYTSTITLTSVNIYDIYKAAQHLEIFSLSGWCEEFFNELLEPHKAIIAYILSNNMELKQFKIQARAYMLTYIGNVLQMRKNGNLSFDQMRARILVLMAQISLKDDTLQKIMEAFIELTNLASHFSDNPEVLSFLLRSLPVDLMPSQLFKIIFLRDIISGSHSVSSFLIDILTPMMNYTGLYWVGSCEIAGQLQSSIFYMKSLSTPWKTATRLCSSKRNFGYSHAIHHNVIFTLGGWDNEQKRPGNNFNRFELTTKQFKYLPPMPLDLIHCAAVFLGSNFYVAGGWSSSKGTLSSMIRFNHKTWKWEPCAKMANPRWGHQLLELNGKLYAIGGAFDDVNIMSWIEYYEPLYHNRECGSSRYSSFLRSHSSSKNKRFVGWEEFIQGLRRGKKSKKKSVKSGEFSEYVISTVEVYDPKSDQWKSAGETNNSCLMFGATVHAGKIYAYSHYGFEVYSPESEKWEELPSPEHHWSRNLVSLNGELLAISKGEDPDDAIVIYYELESRQWKRHPETNASFPWKIHCALAANW